MNAVYFNRAATSCSAVNRIPATAESRASALVKRTSGCNQLSSVQPARRIPGYTQNPLFQFVIMLLGGPDLECKTNR